jgi:hypothetical protein
MTRSQRKTIADLLTAQKLGILATLGQAYPYQNIVAFAASGDLKNILFATRRSTSKYRNLKMRKQVAIFIDDRSNRETDFQQATGVSAFGGARELRGQGQAFPAQASLAPGIPFSIRLRHVLHPGPGLLCGPAFSGCCRSPHGVILHQGRSRALRCGMRARY